MAQGYIQLPSSMSATSSSAWSTRFPFEYPRELLDISCSTTPTTKPMSRAPGGTPCAAGLPDRILHRTNAKASRPERWKTPENIAGEFVAISTRTYPTADFWPHHPYFLAPGSGENIGMVQRAGPISTRLSLLTASRRFSSMATSSSNTAGVAPRHLLHLTARRVCARCGP